jgi:hypothetical protein
VLAPISARPLDAEDPDCARLASRVVRRPFPGGYGGPRPGGLVLATLGGPDNPVNAGLWIVLWINWGDVGESL